MTDITDTPITGGQAIFKIADAIRNCLGEGAHVVRVSGKDHYGPDDDLTEEIMVGYEDGKYGFIIGVQQVMLYGDEHEMIAEQKTLDDRY